MENQHVLRESVLISKAIYCTTQLFAQVNSLITSLCMLSGPGALPRLRNLTILMRVNIQFALRLPKYIGVKLLHDSSGLPYVKDGFLSCATKTLERISKNPLVEESITFNRVNPLWDRFPTPLSVIRPISL